MTISSGQVAPTITVDDQTYLIDSLNEKSKQLVGAVAAAQQELTRLQTLAGITQTALQAYTAALKEELSSSGNEN